jgi:hypothetical protein
MARIQKIGFVIFLVLIAHIFVPFSFIWELWSISRHNLLSWILSLYIAASYIALLYYIGSWGWFGNMTRYTLPLVLVVIAVLTYPSTYDMITASSLIAVEPLISIFVGSIFIILLVITLIKRKLNMSALNLLFPLHGGTYLVAQGGNSHLVNIHVVSQSQRYAIDIVKINAVGLRARGLYPSDPNQYAIFRDEIVSPCDGTVAAVEDGFTDYSPPEHDPEHRAGNYVAIECSGATIYMVHLLKGSICVKVGEYVQKGKVIGRVGNSGNTTEPHLHIHAEEGPYPGHFSGNAGIPIKFNGRFLIRNDHIKVDI